MWNYFKTKTASKQPKTVKPSLLSRLQTGLIKTKRRFLGIFRELLGMKTLDEDTKTRLIDLLIESDVGPNVSEDIIQDLASMLPKDERDTVHNRLARVLEARLQPVSKPAYTPSSHPEVIMLVGVNGAGKTTTVGRLAYYLQKRSKKVYLAAGDTFRAAASEQLQTWAERNQVEISAQKSGSDSASVVFDAYQTAKKQGCDVLIADTAGRLHNKAPLMQELAKVTRVVKKLDDTAPHETWLVLDATVGQNGLVQARKFHESLGLSGIVVTKLDGSAKAGIIFAIAEELALPIVFIGIGEGLEDLEVFDAKTFVRAFLDLDDIDSQKNS